MINFQPDTCTFSDQTGYGMWDDGHAREHTQFVTSLGAKSPAVLISDYNLLSFLSAPKSARSAMLQSHYDAHKLLREQASITGVDLSAVDLDKEEDFYLWLGWHAAEHQQIRDYLGIA
jgi:hypothetical protein